MAYCCVPGCKSCQKRQCDRELSFHCFPSDPSIRQAWIDKIKVLEEYVDPYFQISGSTKVCGRHFTEDCKVRSQKGLMKLKKGSVPTLFKSCRPRTRRTIQRIHRDPHGVQATKVLTPALEKEAHSKNVLEVLHDHNYPKRLLTTKEQLQVAEVELDGLQTNSAALKYEQLFLQRLQHEPEAIMFYTGFKDYNMLKAFYLALQPTPEAMEKWRHVLQLNNTEENTVDVGFHVQSLSLFDQLFLFLCFVRRGFLPVDPMKRLLPPEEIIRTTCVTWSHYLFFMLGTLPIWLSRQAVDKLMPSFFRTTFPKTRVVLDLPEIRIRTATGTVNSSSCKGSMTLKSLVGIAPSGSVSFVSSVYTVHTSDKDIIRESGILNLLDPGDQVMANEGVEIKDLLSVIGVGLVSSMFLGPNRQLNQDEIAQSQDIGQLKLHIERAIGRVKEYRIFDDVVPAALSGSVKQLWTVCALLTNFQGPLLS